MESVLMLIIAFLFYFFVYFVAYWVLFTAIQWALVTIFTKSLPAFSNWAAQYRAYQDIKADERNGIYRCSEWTAIYDEHLMLTNS